MSLNSEICFDDCSFGDWKAVSPPFAKMLWLPI
jgi:hypothetical protein